MEVQCRRRLLEWRSSNRVSRVFGYRLAKASLLSFAISVRCFSGEIPLSTEDVIPIRQLQMDDDYTDLLALQPVFSGCCVIALGEATHGTKEFFQCKHRLLAFLVQEMGVRLFALEASYAGCLSLNDYVLHGKGSRDEALESQGYWIWDTQEMADMLDWMRAYNERVAEEDKVQFLGIDTVVTMATFDRLEDYFLRVEPELVSTIAQFKDALKEDIASWGAEQLSSTCRVIKEVIEQMKIQEIVFLKKASQEEYDMICMLLRTCIQHAHTYGGTKTPGAEEMNDFLLKHPELASLEDPKQLLSAELLEEHEELRDLFARYPNLVAFIQISHELQDRDAAMAENVLWLLEQQKSKAPIVVSAHNGHIAYGNSHSMGYHLRRALGKKYYALGLTFNEGAFRAVNALQQLQEFSVPPPPQDSFSWVCSQVGVDRFIIDFRSLRAEKQLLQPLLFPEIGAGFKEDMPWLASKIVSEEFDGIAFFKTVSASTAKKKRSSPS